jgi:hypothetical protein
VVILLYFSFLVCCTEKNLATLYPIKNYNKKASFHRRKQGCQMVCFRTKNPTLGKFWRVLQRKILAYFINIWSLLRPLEIFYGHLVYFVVIRYIFPRFGILYQEKSGNPGRKSDPAKSTRRFFEKTRNTCFQVVFFLGVFKFHRVLKICQFLFRPKSFKSFFSLQVEHTQVQCCQIVVDLHTKIPDMYNIFWRDLK